MNVHAAVVTAGGQAGPPAIRPRLIALGASNLVRGMLALLDAARSAAGGPIETFAAIGRGRSYGIRSSLLGRRLGGIDDCGLWQALAAARAAPTTALLMDVGNDLLYDVEVPRVLAWVERALERLGPVAQRRIVVGLPMATIRTLANWRYLLVRSVLFPRCRLSRQQMLDRAEQLQLGLAALAAAHGAQFHELPAIWYGFDPVHIGQRHWPTAARTFLGMPAARVIPSPHTNSVAARLRFLAAAPMTSEWFGWTRSGAQPARQWADGTTLSLW